jgi:hypothetical protein
METEIIVSKNEKNNNENTHRILSSVGALGGIAYAFSKDSKFISYLGFGVIGYFVGHFLGNIYTGVKNMNNE